MTMNPRRARRRAVLFGALSLAALGAAPAGAADEATIRIENPWARATPSRAKTGAVYFSLTNTGTTPDTLVAASVPVAAKAGLHETRMANGVMQMRPVGPVTIAPGETLTLKPGGEHLMLIDLTQQLRAGESFPLTLTFEKGGSRTVTVPIEKAGAMGASGAMPGMTTQ